MSDLQDVIATSTKRAYISGINAEKRDLIKLLKQKKLETTCACENCQQWIGAFDFLIATVEGKIHA
jgi:hypothetical protein